MKIPERLNPPPDDWMECPVCHGTEWEVHLPDGDIPCPRCGGDGVVSKAEERRELEAAIDDKEYDAMQDRKADDREIEEPKK